MRIIGILAAAGLGLAAQAGSPAGYLPAVGPSPLRFQAPAAPIDFASLPPLVMEEAKPPVCTNSTEVAIVAAMPPVLLAPKPPAPATNTVVLPFVPTNAAPPAVAAAAVKPAFIDTNDASALSPQMLLHFFRQRAPGGTNRETTIVLPQGFAPPAPVAAPRSSTATFNSP